MIILSELRKMFRPTASRILNGDRLFRVKEWTTNGHWLLLTALEPDFISRLSHDKNAKPDVDKIIKEHVDITESVELKPENRFYYIGGNNMAIRFSAGKQKVWMSAHYVSFFGSLPIGPLKFYQHKGKNLDAVVVYANEELIGMLMPIRLPVEEGGE
jgi:hypothetical protein